jgi:hypothetical protein
MEHCLHLNLAVTLSAGFNFLLLELFQLGCPSIAAKLVLAESRHRPNSSRRISAISVLFNSTLAFLAEV